MDEGNGEPRIHMTLRTLETVNNKYGWRIRGNVMEAVRWPVSDMDNRPDVAIDNAEWIRRSDTNNEQEPSARIAMALNGRHKPDSPRCTRDNVSGKVPTNICKPVEMKSNVHNLIESSFSLHGKATPSTSSIRSIGSLVCRICHNAEHPERLVSPCLCKGSLTYVHIYCLEHWISTSGKTTCELCQYHYKTIQTLRYTCLQSLRMWYSHSMSRRSLQEDCQMFSLLTLVAFGIVGTIIVGIQYYFVQERGSMTKTTKIWTEGWLLIFLFTTFAVYVLNVYMLARGQLAPWYRWWQSARDIKLILENRRTCHPVKSGRTKKLDSTSTAMSQLLECRRNLQVPDEEVQINSVYLNVFPADSSDTDNREAQTLIPMSSRSIVTTDSSKQQLFHVQHCKQNDDEPTGEEMQQPAESDQPESSETHSQPDPNPTPETPGDGGQQNPAENEEIELATRTRRNALVPFPSGTVETPTPPPNPSDSAQK